MKGIHTSLIIVVVAIVILIVALIILTVFDVPKQLHEIKEAEFMDCINKMNLGLPYIWNDYLQECAEIESPYCTMMDEYDTVNIYKGWDFYFIMNGTKYTIDDFSLFDNRSGMQEYHCDGEYSKSWDTSEEYILTVMPCIHIDFFATDHKNCEEFEIELENDCKDNIIEEVCIFEAEAINEPEEPECKTVWGTEELEAICGEGPYYYPYDAEVECDAGIKVDREYFFNWTEISACGDWNGTGYTYYDGNCTIRIPELHCCKFKVGDLVREESQYGSRFHGGVVIGISFNNGTDCWYEIVDSSEYYLSDSQLKNETVYPHHINLPEPKQWQKGRWIITESEEI